MFSGIYSERIELGVLNLSGTEFGVEFGAGGELKVETELGGLEEVVGDPNNRDLFLSSNMLSTAVASSSLWSACIPLMDTWK